LLYLPREKLLFVHIPRTGGHSIYAMYFGDPKLAYENGRRKGFSGQRVRRLGPHATAALIREAMNRPQDWGDCFKFAIVREPVARIVSHWRKLSRIDGPLYGISLGHYVQEVLIDGDWWKRTMLPQTAMLTENGEVIVDKVFRYEDGLEPVRTLLNRKIRRWVRVTPHLDAMTKRGDLKKIPADLADQIRCLYSDDYDRWGDWWA